MEGKKEELKMTAQIGFLKGKFHYFIVVHNIPILFSFRAKQRKDLRYEETRADWYFERKKLRNGNKCLSDDCNSKPKGEKFVKEPHNYGKNHINERNIQRIRRSSKKRKNKNMMKKLNMQKGISVIIKTKTSRKNQRFTEVTLMVLFALPFF